MDIIPTNEDHAATSPLQEMHIRTPDQRVRVFVSSTINELAEERRAVIEAITQLRQTPIFYESGAHPHPPKEEYRALLDQSHIFVGIYWESYGRVAPGMRVSGIEDEYLRAASKPKLIYVKASAPERGERLKKLLDGIRTDSTVCYKTFRTLKELRELVATDLALLLAEHFGIAEDERVSNSKVSPISKSVPQEDSLDIFMCHASDDKPAVRDLYQRLRTDGMNPWLDEEDLLPGQDWKEEISKAMRKIDVVLVCLSHKAVTKAGYVQKEIRDALDIADEQPPGSIFLIPVRLEECIVPTRLRRWQWVNLFQEGGYERLLRALSERTNALSPDRGVEPKGSTVTKKNIHEHELEVPEPVLSKETLPPIFGDFRGWGGGTITFRNEDKTVSTIEGDPTIIAEDAPNPGCLDGMCVTLSFTVTNPNMMQMRIASIYVDVVRYSTAQAVEATTYMAGGETRGYYCHIEAKTGSYECKQDSREYDYIKLSYGELEHIVIRVSSSTEGIYKLGASIEYTVGDVTRKVRVGELERELGFYDSESLRRRWLEQHQTGSELTSDYLKSSEMDTSSHETFKQVGVVRRVKVRR